METSITALPADVLLAAGPDSSRLLVDLSNVLEALVVPCLCLADLQRLGQACVATRALVAGVPEGQLLQRAQVRAHVSLRR